MLRRIKRRIFVWAFVAVILTTSSWAVLATPASAQNKAPASAQNNTSSVPALAPDFGGTSNGIDLPSVAASELEKQAEETAARAAAEDARREEEQKRRAFDQAAGGLLPLEPDQIRAFMNRLESTQTAAQFPYAGPPKGEVKVVSLSLDPGGEPPQINLAAGYVTTIDMVDVSGEPWPILDVGVGGNFEVTPTQAGSHVVRVVPLTRMGTGNLSILLKDLSTPVIFRLSAGGPSFHMRYDARVPKLGPNAKIPLIEHRRLGPVAGDQTIAMILENAPPKEAKRLKISGLDARTMAWRLDEKVFVRTPLTMLSPAWNASASSTDGTTVYEIGDAPVLLMSDGGALVRARLTREEDHDK